MSKATKTTKTEGTPKDPASPKSSTPAPDPAALNQLLAMLAPMLEFHKFAEESSEDDVRLFWDVRLVRAKGEPFLKSQGSSSFPGLMSGSTRKTAATAIYGEIEEKIARPFSSAFQDMIGAENVEALAAASAAAAREPGMSGMLGFTPEEETEQRSEMVENAVEKYTPKETNE